MTLAPPPVPTSKKAQRLKRKQFIALLNESLNTACETFEFDSDLQDELSQFRLASKKKPEQTVVSGFTMQSPTGIALFPEYRTLAVLVTDGDQLPLRYEIVRVPKLVKWYLKHERRDELLDLVAWLDSLAPEAHTAA